ncbi:MAG: 2-amino-4-hydroxy-6-hydroxymethyldihydropteridine diphosphokinase, partial [Prevotella sp.]|nr:2-amino-4-hydroxy-6-hydroxymethyldihydropteridine diphosphokinase [Prevotella sp.]
ALGRRKKSQTKNGHVVYHDRIIDIDILLYDDITVDEPDLKIPHPLMYERDFVMIPLQEVLDRE